MFGDSQGLYYSKTQAKSQLCQLGKTGGFTITNKLQTVGLSCQSHSCWAKRKERRIGSKSSNGTNRTNNITDVNIFSSKVCEHSCKLD